MKRDKRRWIYSGIGLRPGVALVRPIGRPLGARRARVLLVGGQVAMGIAPALGRLAADSKVAFRAYFHRRTSPESSGIDTTWLRSEMLKYRPTVVLVALEPPEQGTAHIDEAIRRLGASVLWLARGGKIASGLTAQALHLPVGKDRMTPTAAGYAAWAAAVWRMIG